MEPNDLSEVQEDAAAAVESMEQEKEATKGLMKGFINKFSGMGRAGVRFKQATESMTYAVKWSQEAEKIYWNDKEDKPRNNADYAKAIQLLEKGIRMLDKVMLDFPETIDTLLPLKKKLMIQLKDLEYLKAGIVKPYDIIQQEVEESLRIAAMNVEKEAET